MKSALAKIKENSEEVKANWEEKRVILPFISDGHKRMASIEKMSKVHDWLRKGS